MARKMKKFSAGGAQGRYERRMADIEKDFNKAMTRKTGKDAEVAEAKRQQRIADAKDDLAKRTGADRTATRAAERLAESNLTKTRKYGAPKAVTAEAPAGKVTDTLGAITAPKSGLSSPAKKAEVKKPVVKTPVQKPAVTTPAVSDRKGDQGFESKAKTTGGRPGMAAIRESAAAYIKSKTGKNETPKKDTISTGPSTKTGLNPNSIAGILARGNFFKTSEEFKKAQEAKYGKAKGGKVKKEKTMKYAKGGSTPPKPTAADRAADAKFRKSVKDIKVTPENAAAIGRANRSEKPGMAKGGKAKSFAATKFGKAMVKK